MAQINEPIHLEWPNNAEEAVNAVEKLLHQINRIAEEAQRQHGVVMRFTGMDADHDEPNRIHFSAWRKMK